LGRDLIADLKERVLDDTRDDGLAANIRRVMTPITLGKFEAKKNDSCKNCHLGAVCRVDDA
jgi:hypothetical protein